MITLQSHSIGIDISDYKLRLVGLRRRTGRVYLQAFNELSLEPGIIESGLIKQPEALSDALRLLVRKSIGTLLRADKNIRVGLPEQQTFVTTLPLESNTPDDIANQAYQAIPFPRAEVYIDTQLIRQHHSVAIAAGQRAFIDQFIDVLDEAHLRPSGLYVEAVAIAQALLSDRTDSAGIILVDIGSARTTITIHVNNSVHFTTSYPSVLIDQRIHTEHLLACVKQILEYYNEHLAQLAPLERILLCGSGATAPGVVELLQQQFSIATEIGDPLRKITRNSLSDSLPNPAAYTTAIGLAMMRD